MRIRKVAFVALLALLACTAASTYAGDTQLYLNAGTTAAIFGGATTNTLTATAGSTASEEGSSSSNSPAIYSFDFYSAPLTTNQTLASGDGVGGGDQVGVYNNGSSNFIVTNMTVTAYDYNPSTGSSVLLVTNSQAGGIPATVNASNSVQIGLGAGGSTLASAYTFTNGHMIRINITLAVTGATPINFALYYNGNGGNSKTMVSFPHGENTITWPFGSFPNQLVFTAQPVSNIVGGTMSNVVVQLENASGMALTNSGVGVTLALNSSSLNGTTTVSTGSNGQATFSNLSINTAGNYTMTATAGSYTSATSSAFNINAAAASELVFTSSPFTVAPGVASGSITVQQQDQYGNPNTTDASRTVTLSSTSYGTVTFNPASLTITNGSSSASFTYADTQTGTPTITAASTSPTTITSAMQQETVSAPGTVWINFDALDTSGPAPVTNGTLAAYLAQYGVSVTANSGGTSVAVENQTNVAGGGFANASSPSNLLTQIGSNGPVSFTVNFATNLTQFSFTRPELLANPFVTHPAWQAQAFDALGDLLGEVQEAQIFSFTNVSAQTYTLNGGAIASVEFNSEGTGLTTFNAMLLDDFVLTPGNSTNLPPSVLITNPFPGQVFTSVAIPISAETAPGFGTVTGVAFFYGGTFAGSALSSPFSISWNAPSNGFYVLTAIATNSAGLINTSAPVAITVASGFAVETPPMSQTIAVSNNATFSVTTTGSNITYQWQFDGTNIAGATSSSYTVSNAPIGAAGSYAVVVNNGSQSITSPPATLTVLGPLTLGSASVATNNSGSNIVLSVTASNSAPFYYQWQLNGANIAGATGNCSPGATLVTYTISNAQPFDSGSYQVVVANTVASKESPTFDVALDFGSPPITTNNNFASSLSINPLVKGVTGINNSSSNTPTDGPALIAGKPAAGLLWYNWTASFTGFIYLTTRGSSFDTLLGVYTGSNVASLTSVAEDDDSGGYFTSQVSFNCMAGTTYQIAVAGYRGATGRTVLQLSPGPAYGFTGPAGGYSTGSPEPVITQQPVNQIVQAGANVTLSVMASNATGYQWYFAGVPVAGGNASTLVISNFQVSAVGDYYVQVSNAFGALQSSIAAIQIAAENQNGRAGTATNLVDDKFGDAVDLTGTRSPTRYRPEDGGGDSGGFALSQSFSTAGATKEAGEPGIAGQPGGASYWYSYTALASGTLEFNTAGSTFNTMLAVYIGPGTGFSTLTNLGAAYTTNYLQQGQPDVVISNVVAGTKYFIAIDGYLGASGSAKLNIVLNPITAALNTNAISLTNNTPIIAITYPANNYLSFNSNITVRGTVKGAHGQAPAVSYVQVALNTNTFGEATMVGVGKNFNWSTNVILVPGANVITAQSIDVLGTNMEFASVPVTRTIFYDVAPPAKPVRSLLTLQTNGHGRITGQPNQANLEIGKVYSITATPINNWVFSNWMSGTDINSLSTLPNRTTLFFVMSNNLILRANFVTNPFTAVAGVYNGLFFPSNGVSQESSGFLTATIPPASSGAYSAKLMLGGNSYPFSGTFNLAGDAGKIVARSGKTSFTVDLHLDLAATNDQMTGSVFEIASNGWGSDLLADRAVFDAKSNPATNYGGRYTLILPPGATAPTNEPGGYGYVTLTNNPGGHVSLIGCMGDGTPISQSVPLSKDGFIPLYASLYSRQGLLLGWLNLPTHNTSNTPPQTIFGSNLSWIKNFSRAGTLYAGGFTNTNMTALGSFYVPPSQGANALMLTNSTLTISNVDMVDPLIYSNLTIAGDKLVNNDPGNPTNQLQGVITPATGILTVTFRPTGTRADITAKGIVLQNNATTNAAGYFLGKTNTGSIILGQ